MREKYDSRLESMETKYDTLLRLNASKIEQLDEFVTKAMADMMVKISQLEDADAIKEYARMQGEQAKQLVMFKSRELREVMDGQYSQLIDTHLRRDNLIGPGDECRYKTIIEFMEQAVAPREIIDEINQQFGQHSVKFDSLQLQLVEASNTSTLKIEGTQKEVHNLKEEVINQNTQTMSRIENVNEKLTDFSQKNTEEEQLKRIQTIVDHNNKLIENHFNLIQFKFSQNMQQNLAQ